MLVCGAVSREGAGDTAIVVATVIELTVESSTGTPKLVTDDINQRVVMLGTHVRKPRADLGSRWIGVARNQHRGLEVLARLLDALTLVGALVRLDGTLGQSHAGRDITVVVDCRSPPHRATGTTHFKHRGAQAASNLGKGTTCERTFDINRRMGVLSTIAGEAEFVRGKLGNKHVAH
jgi:hypothetical protein